MQRFFFTLFLIVSAIFCPISIYAQSHGAGPTEPPIEVTEEDASPSTFPYKLKFPNGTLSDNLDGTTSFKATFAGDISTCGDLTVSGENVNFYDTNLTITDNDINCHVLKFWHDTGNLALFGNMSASGKVLGDEMALHPGYTVTVASSSSRGKNTADFVCDGTADEAEIQAAINICPVSFGGTIKLLEGEFSISYPITIDRRVSIEGVGSGGATKLKLANGANCDMFKFDKGNNATTGPLMKYSDMMLDGNEANQTVATHAFAQTATHGTADLYFENIWFEDWKGTQIYLLENWDHRIERCVFEDCATYAIELEDTGGTYSPAYKTWIDHCFYPTVYTHGGVVQELLITNNIIDPGLIDQTSFIIDCWNFTFENNSIFGVSTTDNTNTTLQIDKTNSSNINISNNNFMNNEDKYIIAFVGSSGSNESVVIEGNNFRSFDGTTQIYNDTGGTITNWVINGNTFKGQTDSSMTAIDVGDAVGTTINGNTFWFFATGIDVSDATTQNTNINGNTFNASVTTTISADGDSSNPSIKYANKGLTTDTINGILATVGTTDITLDPAGDDVNVDGNVGVGLTSPAGRLVIKGIGTTTGIGFQTQNSSGTALVTILDNGNVGIGTTAPLGKLIVKGAGTTTGIGFQTQNSSGTALVTMLDNGNVGIGTTGPGGKLVIKGAGTTTGIGLQTQNSSGTALVTTLDNGNVGIGTTAPGATLDVNGGNILTSGTLTVNGDNIICDGDLTLDPAGNDTILDNSNLQIQSTYGIKHMLVGTSDHYVELFDGDTDTGWYWLNSDASERLSYFDDGSELLRIWGGGGPSIVIYPILYLEKDVVLEGSGGNGDLTVSSGYLSVTNADNSTVMISKINATQANVTAADTFLSFQSTTGVEGSVAGTEVAGIIAYNTWTASHFTQVIDKNGLEPSMVLEIVDERPDFNVQKKQLFKTRICKTKKSKKAIGTFGGTDNGGHDLVLSGGTAFVFVKNTGKDIEIGDLFFSSDLAGCVELQKDDIIYNYTIAKATQSVKWKKGEKKRLISCILLGG